MSSLDTVFDVANVPVFYKKTYDAMSSNGAPIKEEVYKAFLSKCMDQSKLDIESLKKIASLIQHQPIVTRRSFYHTLILIALAQQGKSINERTLEHFNARELPLPVLPNMDPISKLPYESNHPAKLDISYQDLLAVDSVTVAVVPEKKGVLFLKYTEYLVRSKRYNSEVLRRYNDFVSLHELLLTHFPYRLLPRLPPKKIVLDKYSLETRRKSLQRWLTFVCQHPILGKDNIVCYFLQEVIGDAQYKLRQMFHHSPDEFMTSDYAGIAKTLLPCDETIFAKNREQVRQLTRIVGKIKQLADGEVDRWEAQARDALDMADQLKALSTTGLGNGCVRMQKGISTVASQVAVQSEIAQRHATLKVAVICEQLALLLDVLIAHADLCDRLEKGLTHDHQNALQKLFMLKKRKMQGVMRSTNCESVEKLEAKMIAQESIITNMEMRGDFSQFCVHMETQLVQVYLNLIGPALTDLVTMNTEVYKNIFEHWSEMVPLMKKYFPRD